MDPLTKTIHVHTFCIASKTVSNVDVQSRDLFHFLPITQSGQRMALSFLSVLLFFIFGDINLRAINPLIRATEQSCI